MRPGLAEKHGGPQLGPKVPFLGKAVETVSQPASPAQPSPATGPQSGWEILPGKGTANMRKWKTQGLELWRPPAAGIRAEWRLPLDKGRICSDSRLFRFQGRRQRLKRAKAWQGASFLPCYTGASDQPAPGGGFLSVLEPPKLSSSVCP